MSAEPVETLVERVREAHAKAMEALGADVHPYSGPAIRDWETQLDAALTELAERLEAAEAKARVYQGTWRRAEDAVEAAEARVAALEEALREIADEYEPNTTTRCNEIARAALRVEGDEG